jgi:hypothetical protein
MPDKRGPRASGSGGAGGERRSARALAPEGWGHGKAGLEGQWHGASTGIDAR